MIELQRILFCIKIFLIYFFKSIDSFWFGNSIDHMKSDFYHDYASYLLLHMHNVRDAQKYYERSLNACLDNAFSYAGYASVMLILKNIDEALGNINKALAIKQKARFYAIRYMVLWAAGSSAEKSETFSKLNEYFDSNEAETYDFIAYICVQFKMYELAVELRKRAVEIQPDHNQILFNLALTYMEYKQYFEAKKYFERLLCSYSSREDEKYKKQAKKYLEEIEFYS